ncbi:unnamed protein product (macronuclear) [Paramecium tetraurelia]|uniref:Uncharacterized protein n=1 Tax=Paramecium tetraurelia TaxID=5888 RepID=A0ECT5_PARTE|nr:uncharacterized protein GSPATT00003971001 [Paramecium tetraurelia]CAK93102.1 unnamed protein product [Paramecium tetraurelia]|eukprot:XP_001460499.1 hypothetical protein (macronuclear) [Paramecium tetraurelia strain d4-2]
MSESQQDDQISPLDFGKYHTEPQRDHREIKYMPTKLSEPRGSQQYPQHVAVVIDDDTTSNNESRWYAKNNQYKQLIGNERTGFVKKVYSIMIIQLLITMIMCVISYVSIDYRMFQLQHSGYAYLALGIAIFIEVILFCIPKFAWRVPYNYLLLLIFTVCEGYLISNLCSYVFDEYSQNGGYIVLMAASLSLAAVVGLTFYACKTKSDFTTKGALLFMCTTSLLLFGIMAGIYYQNVINLLYSLICSLLFGAYLIYDTQLILGGSTHKLSIDDYIIGSMIIYIDIVYLFAHILMVLIACLR